MTNLNGSRPALLQDIRVYQPALCEILIKCVEKFVRDSTVGQTSSHFNNSREIKSTLNLTENIEITTKVLILLLWSGSVILMCNFKGILLTLFHSPLKAVTVICSS